MQSTPRHKRSALRAIGGLLAVSIGLSGCTLFDDLKPGENIADKYGDYAGFCGLLQDCGGNGNGNFGGGRPPGIGGSPEVLSNGVPRTLN